MALKKQRVEVTRAFRQAGSDVGIGSVVELDIATAQELRNAKKVEFVPNEAKLKVVPLPERKRPVPGNEQRELIELQKKQIESLTQLTTSLSEAVDKLVAASKK